MRTIFTSAPTFSQRFATSFMNDILVASIEFEAYFIISADDMSVNIRRSLTSMKGLYRRAMMARARGLSTPTTNLSGDMKSLTATPSFRNSGFDATSNSTSTPRRDSSSAIVRSTRRVVPTGTVLLVAITA